MRTIVPISCLMAIIVGLVLHYTGFERTPSIVIAAASGAASAFALFLIPKKRDSGKRAFNLKVGKNMTHSSGRISASDDASVVTNVDVGGNMAQSDIIVESREQRESNNKGENIQR